MVSGTIPRQVLLQINGRRTSVFLHKRPVESGIVGKAKLQAAFTDALSALYRFDAGGQAFFCDVLVQGDACVFLHEVGNIVLAEE